MHSVQDLGEASPRSFRSLLIFASGIANPELEKDRTDDDERRRSKDCSRCSVGEALSRSTQQYRS
ncbi:hypothetical protein ACCS78_35380, partial [Rhizobium johnstonii]